MKTPELRIGSRPGNKLTILERRIQPPDPGCRIAVGATITDRTSADPDGRGLAHPVFITYDWRRSKRQDWKRAPDSRFPYVLTTYRLITRRRNEGDLAEVWPDPPGPICRRMSL